MSSYVTNCLDIYGLLVNPSCVLPQQVHEQRWPKLATTDSCAASVGVLASRWLWILAHVSILPSQPLLEWTLFAGISAQKIGKSATD